MAGVLLPSPSLPKPTARSSLSSKTGEDPKPPPVIRGSAWDSALALLGGKGA